MKTAGVMFDFYDDPTGSLLKKAFPVADSLPDMVKEAHILTPEERDVLRDDAYALVMSNEGKILRKFACVDAGNTILSCLYFEDTAQSLPEEAVGVAANNLAAFCEEFGFEPTSFIKAAAKGMSRSRDSMRQPIVGDEADWAARTNLVSVRGGADSGRVIPTANQMKTAAGAVPEKSREGTTLTDDKRNIGPEAKAKHILNKKPDLNAFPVTATSTTVPLKAGLQKISTIVDVSGKIPVHYFEKKASSRYALGNKYPLDSYVDVKKAVEYFDDFYKEMSPEDRHTYCVKTASRAEELGIEVSETLARYGSTEYSPDLEAHLASRRADAPAAFAEAYLTLKEKKASVGPEEFVRLLAKVDEAAGLHWLYDGSVSDPYYATFGGPSEKQKKADWTWDGPNGEILTSAQLEGLAGKEEFKKAFSEDLVSEFAKDPVTIFESLPSDTKTLMSRMAIEA